MNMLSHLKTWFEKSENGMVTKSGNIERKKLGKIDPIKFACSTSFFGVISDVFTNFTHIF